MDSTRANILIGLDLPQKIRELGVPVTEVITGDAPMSDGHSRARAT
jgi:hypothetical protein